MDPNLFCSILKRANQPDEDKSCPVWTTYIHAFNSSQPLGTVQEGLNDDSLSDAQTPKLNEILPEARAHFQGSPPLSLRKRRRHTEKE